MKQRIKTLDFRRRQRPFTLDDLLQRSYRLWCKNYHGMKALVTEEQRSEIYALIQSQVSGLPENPPPGEVFWRGIEFEVR